MILLEPVGLDSQNAIH